MKVHQDLLAYKAAMRDMRKQGVDTRILRPVYQEQIRPSEITGRTLNGKPF
jgi:hypothetical protein